MHLFPICDLAGDHVSESYCACRPMAQIDHDGGVLWVHQPFSTLNEEDLLKQAEAINDSVSVELWGLAEKEKLPVKIVPFKSLEPIRLPKSSSRK